MKAATILLGLAFVTLSGNAFAQRLAGASEQPLDQAARTAVIDMLLTKVSTFYIDPDIAKKMEEMIRARQVKKEYDGITSGKELAKILTEHLRDVCKDKHLEVQFSAKGFNFDAEKPPVKGEAERFRERGRRRNYEFKKVERLDGGVGLLQVDAFYPAEWIADTAAGAMAFLANSEAIIVDIRENHGFSSGGILLSSYFFQEETHLTDFYHRPTNTTRQIWTYPAVAGTKFVDKDLYILTSSRTFSAPESFAYDLQALKRATIVGETTGGGAHATTIYRINDHFSASIPFSRSINPVTKTDWEGTGVKPDVAVPAKQALLTAHLIALKKAIKKHESDSESVAGLKKVIAEKEKELETLKTQK